MPISYPMKGDRVPDLLETTQQQIAARLAKLRPTVEEVKRLEAAVAALEGLGGSTAKPATARAATPARPKSAAPKRRKRRGGRPRGSKSRTKAAPAPASAAPAAASAAETPSTSSPRRSARRRAKAPRTPGGTRALQAVSIITENPGIKVADLARKMGINRTGLYRILPPPELEGKILRRGLRWYPAGS